jgi:NAD(P)H dehydrogenase (quinone)
MILVTGAAGKTGRAVISALNKTQQSIRALVRRHEQVRELQSLGAREIVVGDMRSKATITEAMQAVESVYHICPNVNPDEFSIGKVMIDIARVAGVKRFIFHSVLHPQVEEMPHHWLKLRVEEELFKSKLPFTILQPAAYMQNVLPELKSITEAGVYSVPYSTEAPLSLVDLEDVAKVAAMVLTEDGHSGSVYELAGPQVLTPNQIAEVFGQLLGKEVRAERLPVGVWKRRAETSGIEPCQVETLVKMFEYYDRFGLWGNPRVLTNLLGRSPTTFQEFAERSICATTGAHMG